MRWNWKAVKGGCADEIFICNDLKGFDLKGPAFVLDRCKAVRNGKNFRLWSGGRASTIESIDPTSFHLHICISAKHAEQQVIEIVHLIASWDKPLLYVETVEGAIAPKIIIKALNLTKVSMLTKIEGPKPEIVWPLPVAA
ncbi:hypothetical protein RHIZ_09450 [Rhizobium skierniewicense]|uniref:hypothetical protein n=1 Tax=Rhizobium skierniewicense TaxID=984260 RepID=UPI001FADF999|nr:hypothetical protein [Rhizobium skierniewicense]MCI9866166.1 hypothetical protein [Rhizobium skierniewicense]